MAASVDCQIQPTIGELAGVYMVHRSRGGDAEGTKSKHGRVTWPDGVTNCLKIGLEPR